MYEVWELRMRVAQLEKLVAKLERRLALYENPHTPSSKVRFPEKKEEKDKGKPGRPPGAEGSTRPIPEPDETVEVREEHCHNCGKELGEPALFERRILEDIPEPMPVKVIEYRIAHYRCSCGMHVIAHSKNIPKDGRFGFNTQTEIVLSKIEDRLPLRKVQQALLRRYNLSITAATVFEIERRVYEHLKPEYERIIQKIRKSEVVYCDETTFRVDGGDWWLWVFRTETEILLVLRSTRSGAVAREILGDKFEGIVVSDGYSVYCKLGMQQRCWAHLIRELKFLVEKEPKFNGFLVDLKEFFHNLKEQLATLPPPLERKKLFSRAEKWLQVFLDTAKGWKELKKFTTYLENGMPNWLTFIEHERVEPTNNNAERACCS